MISKKVVQNILNENKFLIMCDLDGTLLKNDGTISKFSCEIIKAVQAMGHKFVIVTGRPPRVSKQYYSQLKLDSLFVNYNGALITNPGDKFFSPLQFGFSRELIKEIFADLLVVKFLKNVIFESYDGVYFFKKPTTKEEHEALISHFHVHLKPNDSLNIVKPNFSNINTDCFSIVLILNDDVSFPTVFDRIRSIASTLSVQSWKVKNLGVCIEISSIFASNKGTTLKFLSAYYGIPLEQCIVFGDGDNDVLGLRKALFGFAVKNASLSAKLCARRVLKWTNEEDGVAHSLQEFFNIKTKVEKLNKSEKIVTIKVKKEEKI